MPGADDGVEAGVFERGEVEDGNGAGRGERDALRRTTRARWTARRKAIDEPPTEAGGRPFWRRPPSGPRRRAAARPAARRKGTGRGGR